MSFQNFQNNLLIKFIFNYIIVIISYRMHLRSYTNKTDIEVAIDVVLQSFFDSQKFSISNRLKKVINISIN